MFNAKKGIITSIAAVSMIASPVTTLAESNYQNDTAGTALITSHINISHISSYATVKKGSRGEHVKTIQRELNTVMGAGLTVDGIAGIATITAIKNYQKAKGITADGIAGSTTWSHLTQDYNDTVNGIVRKGSVGVLVRELQTLLNQKANAGLTVDGIAGAKTVSAIRNYQSSRGLTVDGIAGPKTFAQLRSDSGSNAGSPATSNANNSSLTAYVNSLVGTTAKEWGGGSGTQCVELPKYYVDKYFNKNCKNLGLGNGNTLYSGIATTYSDKFQKITYYAGFQPKVGDIISYHSAVHPDKGHAAIVIAVNGSNYTIAEQWKGSGTVRNRTVSVKAPVYGVSYTIIGVARPRQ